MARERDLDYEVNLKEDRYILYLKVKDEATDMVFSKDVELNVRSSYSLGWILGGEVDGKGQVDMVSISSQTLFLHETLKLEEGLELGPVELVWIDNDSWTSDGRLYVSTAEGSWKFDRVDFNGSPYTSLRYSFAITPDEGIFHLTDSQKIWDKRHILIMDGHACNVSTTGGMIENSFSYWQDDPQKKLFKTAPFMLCNHRMKDIRCFVFYNDESKEFCFISGMAISGMKRLGDEEEDTYSWKTTTEHPGGLDMVAAITSFFGNGQAAALMKSPQEEYYLYCTTPDNTGTISKEGKYEIGPAAPEFGQSVSWAITTNHGYLLYAAGKHLYGLDFRKTPQKAVLLETFDAPISLIKADNVSPEQFDDMFYVATYDDSRTRSGVLYKYQMVDSPDRIAAEKKETWDKGFLKIKSMCWKAF